MWVIAWCIYYAPYVVKRYSGKSPKYASKRLDAGCDIRLCNERATVAGRRPVSGSNLTRWTLPAGSLSGARWVVLVTGAPIHRKNKSAISERQTAIEAS
jgi:hypothetical protein